MEGIANLALRQPNAKIIRVLEQDSDVLERQRSSFTSISEKMPLVCLYEGMPTGAGLVSLALFLKYLVGLLTFKDCT